MTEFIPQQLTFADDSKEYKQFIEKFKPKKTTDDCYTPDNVYAAVLDWVVDEYGIDRDKVIRPFYPGGDFEREHYPSGCVVVDNPPFSILARIVRFYNAHEIKYFLFAPSLTNFESRDCSHIVPGCDVVYENGAKVKTGFLTNLDTVYKVRSAPDLHDAVEAANKENEKKGKRQLPKYEYPDHVITAAKVKWFATHGVDYRLRFDDGYARIGALDAQRTVGKAIFGDGYLLSERAAAERAAAERAAAERAAAERAAAKRWQLSEREKKLVAMLSKGDKQ